MAKKNPPLSPVAESIRHDATGYNAPRVQGGEPTWGTIFTPLADRRTCYHQAKNHEGRSAQNTSSLSTRTLIESLLARSIRLTQLFAWR